MRSVTAFDGEVRLRIDRRALGEQFFERCPRVRGLEQWPRVPPVHALHEHINGHIDPYRDRAFPKSSTSFGINEGAAAGGQNHRWLAQQPRDNLAFAIAKSGLAITREDLRHGASRGEF